MRKQSKREKLDAGEYYHLWKKYIFNFESNDYLMLARLARSWQAQRRGEKDELRASEARLYNDRIEQAKREDDHAFFRRLSRALKALKDSPEVLAEKKLYLAGRVIETAQLLLGQGEKPTADMIRLKIEQDQKRRISDRHWQRLQPLAKKIATHFTAK